VSGQAPRATAAVKHARDRRIGAVQDIADAVLFGLTNPFLPGVTLRVDGGGPRT
jgi:NAD(P)-dependent dehydrogenase (short-subunit alcohol dehydrogenase family)